MFTKYVLALASLVVLTVSPARAATSFRGLELGMSPYQVDKVVASLGGSVTWNGTGGFLKVPNNGLDCSNLIILTVPNGVVENFRFNSCFFHATPPSLEQFVRLLMTAYGATEARPERYQTESCAVGFDYKYVGLFGDGEYFEMGTTCGRTNEYILFWLSVKNATGNTAPTF